MRPVAGTSLYRFGFLILAFCLPNASLHAQEKTVPSGDAPKVSLKAGTWKDVESLIATHRGKIVIVDVWSTSCLPCMTEFPHLVQLGRTHPEDVVCISFNVDYVGIKSRPAETYRERVEKFLDKQQAAFANFLCTQEADAIFAELKLTSIPAVYVYGRDGKIAKRFDDSLFQDGQDEAFTYEKDINPFVAKIVPLKSTTIEK